MPNPNSSGKTVGVAESIPGLRPFGPAFGCPNSLLAIIVAALTPTCIGHETAKTSVIRIVVESRVSYA